MVRRSPGVHPRSLDRGRAYGRPVRPSRGPAPQLPGRFCANSHRAKGWEPITDAIVRVPGPGSGRRAEDEAHRQAHVTNPKDAVLEMATVSVVEGPSPRSWQFRRRSSSPRGDGILPIQPPMFPVANGRIMICARTRAEVEAAQRRTHRAFPWGAPIRRDMEPRWTQ